MASSVVFGERSGYFSTEVFTLREFAALDPWQQDVVRKIKAMLDCPADKIGYIRHDIFLTPERYAWAEKTLSAHYFAQEKVKVELERNFHKGVELGCAITSRDEYGNKKILKIIYLPF